MYPVSTGWPIEGMKQEVNGNLHRLRLHSHLLHHNRLHHRTLRRLKTNTRRNPR